MKYVFIAVGCHCQFALLRRLVPTTWRSRVEYFLHFIHTFNIIIHTPCTCLPHPLAHFHYLATLFSAIHRCLAYLYLFVARTQNRTIICASHVFTLPNRPVSSVRVEHDFYKYLSCSCFYHTIRPYSDQIPSQSQSPFSSSTMWLWDDTARWECVVHHYHYTLSPRLLSSHSIRP